MLKTVQRQVKRVCDFSDCGIIAGARWAGLSISFMQ